MLNEHYIDENSYINKLKNAVKTKKSTNINLNSTQEEIKNIMEVNTNMDITFYNEALLIYEDTKMFDEIIEEISKAKNHIHIEFFIFRNDNIGEKLKNLLIKKAEEGVEVRIIYDGWGSIGFKKSAYNKLKKEGVQIKPYNNVWQSIIKGRLNHRNHRKIVIVDGKVGFTGGINIGDEYLSRDNKVGNWKDILVKIKGEAVSHMQNIFLEDWYYVSGNKLNSYKYFPKWEEKNILPIQIVDGKYSSYKNGISQAYFSIINGAENRLYIATPYLVLSESMLSALQTAALRGVDVKIIVPKNPDLFLVGWANSSFFEKLLNSKVKIYLYEDGFLHSKVFIADNKVVSVGSANFNTRSQYLDYEMNALIFDSKQTNNMANELLKNINDSHEVIVENYNNRSIIQKFKETIGILVRPLI